MYNRILIVSLIILNWQLTYGQIDTLTVLKGLFADLRDSWVYDFKYIEEKEMIYLTFYQDSFIQRSLKLLIKDIHPEGIFLISDKEKTVIRILSNDDGHKFIDEKFKNGFKVSKTTNYVDFTATSPLSEINLFIDKLKAFLKSRNSKLKENENEKIELYIPKTKY